MTVDVDHTAFPIQFDPRAQRMQGTAVHGNMYFDVPIISQIEGNLWQGGCETGLVLPNEIDHLISLYPWERYKLSRLLQSSLSVQLYDDLEGPNREQMVALATWVNICRKQGPTLVHCQAGLNRSGLVAGLALILGGMIPSYAVALLRESRSPAVLCNPVFEKWLLEFER